MSALQQNNRRKNVAYECELHLLTCSLKGKDWIFSVAAVLRCHFPHCRTRLQATPRDTQNGECIPNILVRFASGSMTKNRGNNAIIAHNKLSNCVDFIFRFAWRTKNTVQQPRNMKRHNTLFPVRWLQNVKMWTYCKSRHIANERPFWFNILVSIGFLFGLSSNLQQKTWEETRSCAVEFGWICRP